MCLHVSESVWGRVGGGGGVSFALQPHDLYVLPFRMIVADGTYDRYSSLHLLTIGTLLRPQARPQGQRFARERERVRMTVAHRCTMTCC